LSLIGSRNHTRQNGNEERRQPCGSRCDDSPSAHSIAPKTGRSIARDRRPKPGLKIEYAERPNYCYRVSVPTRLQVQGLLAISAIGFGLIACLIFVPKVEFLLFSIVIFTLGDGLFQPSINAIISNAAPADAQGVVQGANQSQQALARMLGPLLAAVLSPLSLGAPYWMAGLIALAGVGLLLKSRQPAPSEAA
jgi:MFS family permease